MANIKYIPALRFHWLTNIYDWLISSFMPEKKFKSALIENANVQVADLVLDFGIGTGTLSIMAFEKMPAAFYTGIDMDENFLTIAKNKIEVQKALITLIKYNGSQLPFADSTFHRVISSLVFHHLTTMQKTQALCEIKRVLKPGGELHIADWGKPSNFLMRGLFHLVQLLDGYKTTDDNIKGKLPELIKNSGLKVVQTNQNYNTVLGSIQLFSSQK